MNRFPISNTERMNSFPISISERMNIFPISKTERKNTFPISSTETTTLFQFQILKERKQTDIYFFMGYNAEFLKTFISSKH